VVAVLITLVVLSLAACGSTSNECTPAVTGHLPDTSGLLFVVRGEATVKGNRLEIEAKDVIWFTDRPQRCAGIGATHEIADKWEAYGFGEDPPNAAAIGRDTEAVVELGEPEAGDGAISFAFKAIQGDLRGVDGDQLSIFIDTGNPTQIPIGTPIGQ
jgi:hypothetical protein